MMHQAFVAEFQPVHRDQFHQEHEHDSYQRPRKMPEPPVCPDCGAIFHSGHWQWGAHRPASKEVICPACHRIRNHLPAAFLHVGGPYFVRHCDELLTLIRHLAEQARAGHPLARIMNIKGENGDCVLITTTDIHLARDLAEALHHTYHGVLTFHYNAAEKQLHVDWQR